MWLNGLGVNWGAQLYASQLPHHDTPEKEEGATKSATTVPKTSTGAVVACMGASSDSIWGGMGGITNMT